MIISSMLKKIDVNQMSNLVDLICHYLKKNIPASPMCSKIEWRKCVSAHT